MIGGARRIGARIKQRLRPPRPPKGPAALVLCYHRVASLERDTQLMAVEPERFSRQLAALSKCYRIAPLMSLVAAAREGSLPHRSVALTFDDGYADNLLEAAPRLERAAAHATVFVTTNPVDRATEYWWDRVERAILETPSPPGSIALPKEGLSFGGLEPEPAGAAWNVSMPPSTNRQRAYLRCCGVLRTLAPDRRDRAIDEIERLVGDTPGHRATHAPLTPEQVGALHQSPAIDVGAHTLDHPVLSLMQEDAQREQILGSRDRVAELIGREPGLFSYPFGTRVDFDNVSTRLAREAGFAGACANIPGLLTLSADPFALPRVLVRDWEPDDLLAAVGRAFAGEVRYH